MVDTIDRLNHADPIAKQFIPSIQELHHHPKELPDPIGDQSHSPVKGIVHRYPDRVLLMPVQVCPVYCRFCFRRETVGSNAKALSEIELSAAIDYIRATPAIWEVILTGGDPLVMKSAKIAALLTELAEIPHVGALRIHTRIPVVDPKRITTELIHAMTMSQKPVTIVLHANHPKEFTQEACQAISALIDAGIPLLSQSVLLKGVNDDIETLIALMRHFVSNRVQPYYLHHPDLARGTSHFGVSIARGIALMRELHQKISGVCQPRYVLEIPGGYSKVSLLSTQVQQNPDEPGQYILEDANGIKHRYHDLYFAENLA